MSGDQDVGAARTDPNADFIEFSDTPAGGDAPRFSAKMTAFLAAIQVMPVITRAARAAGIHRGSHYRKLKSVPAYARAFEEALRMGWDVSDLAIERAHLGWEDPVVYRGRVSLRKDPATGELVPLTVRKHDNQLLAFILAHRHPDFAVEYVQRRATTTTGRERVDC